MQPRSVIERIEIVERKVEVLETLPEGVSAVELQLVQLRDEMRAEFSALRGDMRAGDEETRRTLRQEAGAARGRSQTPRGASGGPFVEQGAAAVRLETCARCLS
jgi:hypothetical protein